MGEGLLRARISSKFVSERRDFSDWIGNKKYVINYDFDCDSTSVVYLAECEKCSKQYIGNTMKSFEERFNDH